MNRPTVSNITHFSPRPGLDPGPLALINEAPDQVRGGWFSDLDHPQTRTDVIPTLYRRNTDVPIPPLGGPWNA